MNKKTSNASKKPTSLLTLVNRTYRKVLELEKSLTNQIALNRLRIEELNERPVTSTPACRP